MVEKLSTGRTFQVRKITFTTENKREPQVGRGLFGVQLLIIPASSNFNYPKPSNIQPSNIPLADAVSCDETFAPDPSRRFGTEKRHSAQERRRMAFFASCRHRDLQGFKG